MTSIPSEREKKHGNFTEAETTDSGFDANSLWLRPRVVFFLGFGLIATQGRFLANLFEQLGMRETQIGTIFAVSRLGNTFCPMIWGALSDRVLGMRKTMALCALLSCVFYLPFGLFPESIRGNFGLVLLFSTLSATCLLGIPPIMDSFTLLYLKHTTAEVLSKEETQERQKAFYGSERLWGAVGWSLVHFVLGILLDIMDSNYLVMVPSCVMLTLVFVLVVFADSWPKRWGYQKVNEVEGIELEEVNDDTASDDVTVSNPANLPTHLPPTNSVVEFARILFCSVPNVTFITAIFIISGGASLAENLVFIFFKDEIGAGNLLMGISVFVTCSFEIPLFAVANQLTKKFSTVSMLSSGLYAYVVRVFIYSAVPRKYPALLLLAEPLHGVTYAMVQLSAIHRINAIAPPAFVSFAQGALLCMRNLGFGFGVILGSYIMEKYGSIAMYRGAGAIVFFTALLYGAANYTTNRQHVKGDGA